MWMPVTDMDPKESPEMLALKVKEDTVEVVSTETDNALLRARLRYFEQEDARKAQRIDELQKELDELKRKP